MTTTSPPGTKQRLSGMLYDELRSRIIAGHYPQGHRLIENEIAEEMQVSRIPVREALPRLATDGFVQHLPRRGAQVTVWNSALVDELFDARLALEVRAAILAARRAQHDAAIRDQLDTQVRATREAMRSPQSLEFATTHAQLHQTLVDIADNGILSSLMQAVAGRLTWMFHLTSQNDQSLACAEHETIVDAICSGNERLAESRVYAHIEAGRAPGMAAIHASA
ncbi:GntR family transcriptional regulator [Isoptericola sp. NPDC057391]|uniref:GntR family transcriptional regulator n=1 Tax=Isoptericola sp. NPDC057391 TaxID=3346117 RepID=UPI00363E47BE